MSYNKLKFYDFEIYPEFWCSVVSDEIPEDKYKSVMYHCATDKEEELSLKNQMRCYASEDKDTCAQLEKLILEKYGITIKIMNDIKDFKADMLVGIISGYNNKRFDNILLKCVFMNFTPEQLDIASELLIYPENAQKSFDRARISNYIKYGWNEGEGSQDFMDDSFKGLKDKEASYGLDIRETTVPFGKKDLTLLEKAEIIYYCMHDVYALHVHYSSVARAYVDTKVQLTQIFGFPLKVAYNNTNAVLSGKVLEATRAHGTTIKDPTIVIRDKELDAYFRKYIPREVYTTLLTGVAPKGQQLVTINKVKGNCVDFHIYENEVSVGDGGLHSTMILPKVSKPSGGRPIDPAIYIESTEEYAMFNIDASSCYTSVMIYCDAISRGIKNPQRLVEIYQRRMKLKATPKKDWSSEDKYFVNAAKLVLNTTYGAMGNEHLPLYDDYMRSKTCRIGQMVLIALANSLYTNVQGLKVIQNNTDGVLVYTKRSNQAKIQELVDEFSVISKFIFEVEEDKLLWQLNVNNYIAIDPKDKMKDKGGSFVHDIHQPGYYHIRPLSSYCIPKAQIAFYRDTKINPVQRIVDNINVSDFCMTCTKGPGYYGMFHLCKDGEIELGKVARAIAVIDNKLGKVVKRKIIKKDTRNKVAGTEQQDTCALCPNNALIVNDALYNYKIENGILKHVDGRKWRIDYGYYCRELDGALDVPWFKLKNESLALTQEFNL